MIRLYLLGLAILSSIHLAAQDVGYDAAKLSYAEIDSLLDLYDSTGTTNKAIPLLQAAREKAKAQLGERDTVFAQYSNLLGDVYAEDGAYKKALPLYLEAKEIREEVLGEEHPDFAISLNNLAILHYFMGNYEKALPLYIRLKDIKERVSGKMHPDFAASLSNLAVLYKTMGNYEKAMPLYVQAKNIKEKTLEADDPDLAATINELALLYQGLGRYEEALPLFIQSKTICEKAFGEKHPYVALSLNNLAVLYRLMGAYEKALPPQIQAVHVYEETLGKAHPNFAASLNNLAMLHKKMEAYDKALPLYIQAKDIRKEVLGAAHPDFAESLHNLALLYQEMGDYEAALPLYLEAKEIEKEALGEAHPDFATSLGNLAELYQSMGNYDKALPLYLQANAIREQVLGRRHPRFILGLNNLVGLYLHKKNYSAARETLRQAIYGASNLSIPQTFDADWLAQLKEATYPSMAHLLKMIESLELLYTLLEQESSMPATDKQERVVALATALLDQARNQFSADQDQLRMLKQSNDWLLRALSLFPSDKRAAEAFELADKNKSVLLLSAMQSKTANQLGNLPDSLIQEEKALLKKREKLQAQLLEGGEQGEKDHLRNELIAVNQAIDAWRQIIKQDYPKYHQLKYQRPEQVHQSIQALLDDKTMLLEYVIADSLLHIFTVNQEKVSWHKVALTDGALKAKIQTLHESLSNYKQSAENAQQNYETYTRLAHWFYQKLVAPVLPKDEAIKHLIVVTDGELGHLPFEVFLTAPAPAKIDYKHLPYLLRKYSLSYSYSAMLWKENQEAEARQNNGQLFAMAAQYKEDLDSALLRSRSERMRFTREGLQPIPAARREVEALAQRYLGYFGFDSLATERDLCEKAADYAIIHLATHGLLNEEQPLLSAMALTEDGDSLYDNFWQAHEISKMELNADLAVLSACETGYGRFETGNGIASLARSFMYAGVPALVVSLWQVNDMSTSTIMQDFYGYLADGMDKAEALRQAKLNYIDQTKNPVAAHPAFWSPFILMGDAEPVDLAEQGAGNWLWWGIGGAALLILLLGWLRWRKA